VRHVLLHPLPRNRLARDLNLCVNRHGRGAHDNRSNETTARLPPAGGSDWRSATRNRSYGISISLHGFNYIAHHPDSVYRLRRGMDFRGAKYGYIGLQLVFAFYLVAFEGFSAPTQLAPARDRCAGILFAIIVMWFVFDQVWPIRTVTAMRRGLASVLRSGANLFLLTDSVKQHDQLQLETDSLRDRLGKNISALRTMSEAVEYEFGVDREGHIRSSELMLQISMTAAALIWNQVAVLHDERDSDFIAEPGLVEMRRQLAAQLNSMAEAVDSKTAYPLENMATFVSLSMLNSLRYGEYIRNTIARYEDLQNLALELSRET